MTMKKRRALDLRWRRNLYEVTGLPDNYTPDDCFLDAIQKNRDLQRPSLSRCVAVACRPGAQMAAAACFVAAYVALGEGGAAEPEAVGAVAAALSLAGYLWHKRESVLTRPGTAYADLKHVLVFLSFGFGLCPVLYKLTDTISTDTIHTTSGLMLALHLLFHEYGADPADGRPNALSLNAALFAAVCLASRLGSTRHAFVLLAVAVVAFMMFPLLRKTLSPRLVVATNAVGGAAASALIGTLVSPLAGLSLAAALAFVSLVAPALFVRWQRHKDTIHGPWDEAVPKIE